MRPRAVATYRRCDAYHLTSRPALVLLVALQLVGCGEAPPVSPSVPDASRELLVGTWGVDFEASWVLSRDAFLADTIRGAAAYPDDPEEKARIVQDEMRRP
ncbi:MAG: hypothetical protein R3F05_19655 [Planctomycetota bacterium]